MIRSGGLEIRIKDAPGRVHANTRSLSRTFSARGAGAEAGEVNARSAPAETRNRDPPDCSQNRRSHANVRERAEGPTRGSASNHVAVNTTSIVRGGKARHWRRTRDARHAAVGLVVRAPYMPEAAQGRAPAYSGT